MTGESGDTAEVEDQSAKYFMAHRKPFQPSQHLHLIRELPPDNQPGRHVNTVFCVACQKAVFIICLEMERMDPIPDRARFWLKGDPKLSCKHQGHSVCEHGLVDHCRLGPIFCAKCGARCTCGQGSDGRGLCPLHVTFRDEYYSIPPKGGSC